MISVWATAAVEIVTPTSFTIEPCGEAKVLLVVEIGGDQVKSERLEVGDVRGVRGVRDLHDCVVAYADLRVKGCDIRSVRIAVAILPRDCDDFVIDCQSGCC